MAKLREIVFDALNPPALARFWADALDDYHLRPYDDAEIARLDRAGLSPETDPCVAVDGDGPTLFFQKVNMEKTSPNRLHLDLACENRALEVERLVGLGASIRSEHAHHTVLRDPEGNEFCVQEPRSARG